MEQPMRCKTLTAIYKNEINTLKKLYEIDFLIHKSVRIHIEQFTVRKIEIDFTSEQLVDDLIAVLATVYKGNIIKNLIMDCQSYTKYRPNETTGGIFVSWRRKEELPTGA